MAIQTTTLEEMAPAVDAVEGEGIQDEEKAFLLQDRPQEARRPHGLSYKFWLSAAINTISTITIVYTQPRDYKAMLRCIRYS